VERATDTLVGVARDVTDAGHLVVATDDGRTQTITAGDVVHLRDA
jgi:biotin-(acetyl-CoA carboxylase) ligase